MFELEISIQTKLSTTGVNFESPPASVIIPGNSFYSLSVVGRAIGTGILTVKGCVVQAPGGRPRQFFLPLATEEEETNRQRRRGAIQCESDRTKVSGLASRSITLAGKRISSGPRFKAKPSRFLECQVISEQPLLRIRRTSITHGAVMLYSGERFVTCCFCIEFELIDPAQLGRLFV